MDVDKLFIKNYFNVHILYDKEVDDESFAMGRIIDALIKHFNTKEITLPQYLVVIPDKDLLEDIDQNLSFEDAVAAIGESTRWLVRQINTAITQKRKDLLEKLPGSVTGINTKVIHVCMLRRFGKFHEESKMYNINLLRSKFNDVLNSAAAKVEHYMLTINSCQSYEHFERKGRLSIRGKSAFWMEIDNLLQRFDRGAVKLKPNPKNIQGNSQNTSTPRYDSYHTIDYKKNATQHNKEDYRRHSPAKSSYWRQNYY